MKRKRQLGAAMVAIVALGCQAIIGQDFSGYETTRPTCDPLSPGDGGTNFASCPQGKKCNSRDPRFVCETDSGTVTSGGACTSDSECSGNLGCLFDRCATYCDAKTGASCPADERCVSVGKQAAGRELGACVKSCDLEKPSACASDERCTVAGGVASCAKATSNAGAYDPCSGDLDCPHGLGCAQVGKDPVKGDPIKVCLRWATTSASCTPPERMIASVNPTVVDGKTYQNCFAPCDVTASNSPDPSKFRTCGAGSRCSFILDQTGVYSVTVCTKVATPANRDQPCSVDSDCAAGMACRGFSNFGFCVDYCQTQPDCPSGRTCTPFTNKRSAKTTGSDATYNFCAPPPACNPVNQTPCAVNESCTLLDNDYAVCHAQGSGVAGDWCGSTTTSYCVKGEACIGATGTGYYCSAYCRVGGSDCGTQKCYGFGTPIKVGTQEYGYCNPPDCDPFNPQGAAPPLRDCPNGVECHFISSAFTACRSGSNAGVGASCKNSVDCGAGLFCLFDSNSAGTCYVPCRVSKGNADCIAKGKTTCGALSTPFKIDGVEYGQCN